MFHVSQRRRKPLAVAALMALSGLALYAPATYSDGMKHLMQLLVPFQSVLYRTGWTAAQHLHQSAAPDAVQDETSRTANRDRAALDNAVVVLNAELEQVRRENGLLKGLRDRYIPPGVRLVTAQVVTPDISGWRDALLLSRGSGVDTDRKIRRNDLVASRVFLSAGEEDGARVGHLVLAREFLLGEIEQVSPFMSRVRLFSDIGARTEVRLGRNVRTKSGMQFQMVDYPCTLLGRGHGQMVIEHVPERYISENPNSPPSPSTIREGDLVVRVPSPPALPTVMVVGSVRSPDAGRTPCFERDPRRPLVATIHVQAALAPDEISNVFIVASGPDR